MATIKQVSDELGVSKPFIGKIVRELDPNGEHQERVKNRIELDAWLASAAAAEAVRRKAGGTVADTVADEDNEVPVTARSQTPTDASATDNERYQALLDEKDARIADLKELVDRLNERVSSLETKLEKTQTELMMARELQGFRWPWQRRAILARYAALPAAEGDR